MSDSLEGAPSSAPDAVTASVGTPAPSAPAPDNTAGSGPAAQDAPSASPSDAPVDDRAALLDVVKSATRPRPENSGSEGQSAVQQGTQPAPGAQPASPTGTPDPLDVDPSTQELEAFAPPTRKRVERLLQQRNQARTELEALKEPAAKWDQLHGYLQTHKLAVEDVNLLLGIGAHMRAGNWRAVRDGMAPYWQLANEALGDLLPQDLQARVANGEVTHEMAAEMTRLRHQSARANGQVQAQTEEANRVAAQQNSQAVNAAVTAWEQQIIQRDPDYARKAGAVLRSSQALMSQHPGVLTPNDAVQIAQRAYDEVSGWAGQWRPIQAQGTRPVPSSTRAINGARPQPNSLMEAALAGLARSRTTH